jgi:hypothetical protein
MATYSAVLLSGSTDGKPIPVAATATPGTLIHTAVTGSVSFDEVYLWASNVTGTQATLTIEWGGVTDPGSHLIKAYPIPANSIGYPVAPGTRINNGAVIRAFSGTASAINIVGNVNRIAP